MTTKFEQLIEYVINNEESKARELFHDIVVAKSREIYESLMDEEDTEEESVEEGMEMDDESTGRPAEDLIDQVETEEEGMNEEDDAEFDDEAEEEGEDVTHGEEEVHDAEEDSEDIEDRVVDLEDKLDELMAEFEALMGDDGATDGDEMEPVDGEVGGDAYMDDDTSEFQDEPMPMSENITLAATPKPETSEPSFVNKKSTTAFNSGAAGMAAKPVKNVASEANPDGTAAYKAPTSYADKGRGELPGAGKFQNTPAKNDRKMTPATKPVTSQASGTNTRTPFPKG